MPLPCLLTWKVLPFVFLSLTQVVRIVVSRTVAGNVRDSPSESALRLPAMLIPLFSTNFVISTIFNTFTL